MTYYIPQIGDIVTHRDWPEDLTAEILEVFDETMEVLYSNRTLSYRVPRHHAWRLVSSPNPISDGDLVI